MNCNTVDELAGAYALGAIEPDEERAISEHLAACDELHEEARDLIGTAGALHAIPEPVSLPPALRARILATAAATQQEHAPAAATQQQHGPAAARIEEHPSGGRQWWSFARLAPAMAAAGLALAIGLGAWGITLQQQVAERNATLRAIAGADAAYQVSGDGGSGWLIETDGEALFVAEGLAALPRDLLYELWLIEPDGSPIAVGVITQIDDLHVVALERPLGEATVFAVTVEAGRVDAPTSDPVLLASLDS